MFGLFKKKTEAEKLNKKYDKLMQEGYELSTINRKASDAKYAEAEGVLKQLEKLPQSS
ncbi:MAG: Lacal_2735 family protein [Prolixibacteraceae bacterium]